MKTLLLILAITFRTLAQGSSYSFIVKFEPSRIYVSSPKEITGDLSVIIENKTLGPIWSNIVTEDSELVGSLGIPSMETRSFPLKNFKKDQIYYLIPLSPPFQKILLKFDKSSYEIPPLIN